MFVDISYNIENFKAKVSNVLDDKHLGIKMSTSRGHAPMPDGKHRGKHKQTIDFLGDIVFPEKKGAVLLTQDRFFNELIVMFRTNMLHAFFDD